jgi:hypothetical protein
MLEEFRQQANTNSFFDDLPEEEAEPTPQAQPAHRKRGSFLGLTPFQRFVVTLLLFVITIMFSAFWLLLTESVIPPFMM